MKIKGRPNQVVHSKRRPKNRKLKKRVLFKFDENGIADIDESKFNETTLRKIRTKFEVIENPLGEHLTIVDKPEVMSTVNKADPEVFNKLSWPELKKYAADFQIKEKKKADIIEELNKLAKQEANHG